MSSPNLPRAQLTGSLLVVLSAVSFGVMPIFARMAYNDGADPNTLLFIRFSVAAFFLISICLARGIRLAPWKNLVGLFLMGAVGYVGQSLCYFNALTQASASLVALLLYTYPIMVAALSIATRVEGFSRAKLLAMALSVAGGGLIIGLNGGGSPTGILLGLMAAVIYSLYIFSGFFLLKGVDPLQAAAVIMLSAAVVFGGVVAIGGAQTPGSISGWFGILAIALISTVVASVTFFAGLQRVGPIAASTISTLEPVTTVTLSVLLLREPFTLLQGVGGLLILAGAVLVTRSRAGEAAVEAALSTQPGGPD